MARIQAFVVDPVGLLVQLLEGIEAGETSLEDVRHVVTESLCLLLHTDLTPPQEDLTECAS